MAVIRFVLQTFFRGLVWGLQICHSAQNLLLCQISQLAQVYNDATWTAHTLNGYQESDVKSRNGKSKVQFRHSNKNGSRIENATEAVKPFYDTFNVGYPNYTKLGNNVGRLSCLGAMWDKKKMYSGYPQPWQEKQALHPCQPVANQQPESHFTWQFGRACLHGR